MLLVGIGTGPKSADNIHREVFKEGSLWASFTVHVYACSLFWFFVFISFYAAGVDFATGCFMPHKW